MTRKSPIKHRVRTHKRSVTDGLTTVHEYERGHGKHPANLSKPRLGGSRRAFSIFNVHVRYVGQPTDNFPVHASSYPEAIELALLSRVGITPPMEVTAEKR